MLLKEKMLVATIAAIWVLLALGIIYVATGENHGNNSLVLTVSNTDPVIGEMVTLTATGQGNGLVDFYANNTLVATRQIKEGSAVYKFIVVNMDLLVFMAVRK